MVDIGAFVREVQADFPQGHRSPAAMALLYGSTVDAWNIFLEYWEDSKGTLGLESAQLERDMDAFVDRMEAYRVAIEESETEEELTPKIRGFLVNFPGSGHPTPDFATPYSFFNQLSAAVPELAQAFLDSYKEALEEAPEVVGEALGKTARKVGEVTGEAIGGFASGLGLVGIAVGVGVIAGVLLLRSERS